MRALHVYMSALNGSCPLVGIPCFSYENFLKGRCVDCDVFKGVCPTIGKKTPAVHLQPLCAHEVLLHFKALNLWGNVLDSRVKWFTGSTTKLLTLKYKWLPAGLLLRWYYYTIRTLRNYDAAAAAVAMQHHCPCCTHYNNTAFQITIAATASVSLTANAPPTTSITNNKVYQPRLVTVVMESTSSTVVLHLSDIWSSGSLQRWFYKVHEHCIKFTVAD